MIRCVSIVVFALVAGSCSLVTDSFMTRNHCASDADCTTGRCDVSMSMCVGSASYPLQVGLEIAVPASGASVGSIWPVAPFSVTEPTTRNIPVPRPVAVAGTARQMGRTGVISADIVFTPSVVIPGRSGTVIRASTTATGTTIGPVAIADYVAQLSGSTQYTVTIVPTGDDRSTLPPLVVATPLNVPVAPDGGVFEADFSYPATFDMLDGDLVNAAGDPLPGLTVQAVDASGAVVSSTVVSAPASDPRPGSFSLALAPGAGDVQVRVSAVGAGSTMPVPTFTADPRYLYPTASGRARVLVPDVHSITYQAMVARAGTGAPVVGATVELRSHRIHDPATGVNGLYSPAPVATDAAGMFQVVLVPGTYDVVIVPSGGTDSDLGVLVADPVMLDSATMDVRGMLFELPTRPTYGGTVTTVDGHTMTGATVAASSLGIAGCAAAAYARSATTSSDPTGQFQMHVDCGTYDVVVEPPADSGYAWTVHTGVGVPGVTVPDAFSLEAPVPISGVVTDATGAPVAGAEIRAFGVLGPLDAPQRSVGVGSVTTDAMGRYTLLLPPTL